MNEEIPGRETRNPPPPGGGRSQPPDPDLVARILAELAHIPRGPIDPAREPLLPMDGDDGDDEQL